jgi:hypothetical protein
MDTNRQDYVRAEEGMATSHAPAYSRGVQRSAQQKHRLMS